MTTDLITLRRDILAGAERTHLSLMDRSNNALSGIALFRERSAKAVEYSRQRLAAALDGTYRA